MTMSEDDDCQSLDSYSCYSGSDNVSNHDSTTPSTSDTPGASKDKQKAWFHISMSRDSRKVMCWMLVVLGMIAVTAAVVLSFSYTFLTNEEKSEFENGFQQQTNVIAEATRFHAKTVVGSLESMSTTITSFTGATSANWPFLTVPDFDRRGKRARTEAFLEMIGFSPIVTYEDRNRWAEFSTYQSGWLGENASSSMYEGIYRLDESDDVLQAVADDNILMAPVWLTSPKPNSAMLVNYNLLSDSLYKFLFNAMTESKHTALSAVYKNEHMYSLLHAPTQDQNATANDMDSPHSVLMAPVYDSFNVSERSLSGVIHGTLPWDSYLKTLLPPGVNGIICVLQNSCGQSFTYRIDGPEANYIGQGDLHDTRYDDMAQFIDFGDDFLGEETRTYRQCFYSLVLYPSKEFEQTFASNDTVNFTALLASVFILLALFFFIFVWFVQARQQKVMGVAVRTSAIISGLFPDNVRDRIMKSAEDQANREMAVGADDNNSSSNLKSILQEGAGKSVAPFGGLSSTMTRKSLHGPGADTNGISILQDAPIADLYPNCTVCFADIRGFTAWSSSRDPAQVFVLLETLYGAFDTIAKRRRVFKVETIGDCYVAVAGLPQPRRDHATAMARFSHDCLVKSSEVFHALEVSLGPGTSNLTMRIGLHSGPVTAGVLRGEKGRFQLFGDTVNTAARIESNGRAGKIHCSKDTADLIDAAGKSAWLSERPDIINAKGKGELQTFWLHVKSSDAETSRHSGDSSESALLMKSDPSLGSSVFSARSPLPSTALNPCQGSLSKDHSRLVDWNTALLSSLLQKIVNSRRKMRPKLSRSMLASEPRLDLERKSMPFDEWTQAIELPEKASKPSSKDAELPEEVLSQLRQFVGTIACLHGDNHFHCFDHASHVCMSVHKLLMRVVESGEDSYRVASDPLTHFAAVLSALIHDVDHRGVPNVQLIKEEPALAAKYHNKSVAEQHAIDLAWAVLMGEEYKDLRGAIYTTQGELQRFRTVVVNSVLSTDLGDPDLKKLRNERWNLAFNESSSDLQRKLDTDVPVEQYRASSVLEHLIQASDVSHTMQHWHVYRRWNQKLFKEMYQAYQDGRAETDPSINWYKGELGFFDFYIIPLAKKLAEVGVFGVSSDEYLNYALKNRAEWEMKGKDVVAEMLDLEKVGMLDCEMLDCNTIEC